MMSESRADASLCLPTDENFEAYRKSLAWQAIKPDSHPHAIWQARNEADIVSALAHARLHGLKVSIVSGGHSYIGHGIQDGTLLLDLSQMKAMAVDPERRCGWVEPGVRVAEFDMALESAGLAFPIGHEPNVGLVGYLLGGGLGWNADRWNHMACFNVTVAEIILASGEKVVADQARHPDLFWAVRGAGPNFCGVVTRFHVKLFSRPQAIRKSEYVFSLDALDGVLAWLGPLFEELDDRIELTLAFFTRDSRKQCMVSIIVFADDADEARVLTAPFTKSVPDEEMLSRQEAISCTFATLLDEKKGDETHRRAVESVWTDDPFSAARAVAQVFAKAPSPDSIIYFGLKGGKSLPGDAACSMFGRGFVLIDAAWRADADDDSNVRWVDDAVASLHPYDKGSYINETDLRRRPERTRRCYSQEAYQRLGQIIVRHDPDGLFARPCGENI